ncbi:MAG TPA: methyltransferase [Burkholderiales bacterium]|nr:methyltransferase [Burkholderiales bacterium]
MAAAPPASAPAGEDLGFLVVDEFLRTLIDARALKTAFELGLVERLLEHRHGSAEALGRAVGVDSPGLRFLLDLLCANGVTEERDGDVRLSRRFLGALRYRDLLEAKLDFAGFTLNDFADLFTALVRDPGGFSAKAGLYRLFDYRRALEPSAENYARTRAWMRITSALTRYEARACLQLHDFGRYRRALDVGGNSGEFLLQVCRRHAGLHGTVFDLPLVCEVGMEHLLGEPEQPRIGFIKADLRRDPLPRGYDLISFKSMLHDWPAQEAQAFVAQAAQALEPGGTLLVFERAPLRVREATPPFSLLPTMLFFRSYRPAQDYVAQLQELGMRDVAVREVELDAPFYVVSAVKGE